MFMSISSESTTEHWITCCTIRGTKSSVCVRVCVYCFLFRTMASVCDSVGELFYAVCVCVYWMWSRSLSFSQTLASRSVRSRTPAPRRCSERPPAAWGYRGDDLWSAERDREREISDRVWTPANTFNVTNHVWMPTEGTQIQLQHL